MPSSSSDIRIGLIGAGPWGRNIVRTIGAMEGAALSLVLNRSGRRPDFVPETIPVTAYVPELLDPRVIDAAVIATPPNSHAAIAIAALQRGLPVFIEKPLTLDAREAADIAAQHRLTPAPFFVDHIYLYHAGFRALKSALADAGRIRAIASVGGNRGPFRPDTPMLWDWAPHDIAMCLDLIGALPEEVTCHRSEIGENGLGQRLDFSMDFRGPCQVRISIGNIFPERRRHLTVFAENGMLRFEDEGQPCVLRYPATEPFQDPQGSGAIIDFSGEMPLTKALGEFCHAIRRNDNSPTQLQLGMNVVGLIERLEQQIPKGNGSQ